MKDRTREHRPMIVLLLSATTLFGVVCCIFIFSEAKEPTHAGRSLSRWTDDLGSQNQQAKIAAENAILAIGTNAISHLVAMIESRDSPERESFVRITRRLGLKRFQYSQARAFQSVAAFKVLGTNAASAIPELARIIEFSPDRNYRAEEALGGIGVTAIPALQVLLTNENKRVRSQAASALGWIGLDAKAAIPDLLLRLNEESSLVRWHAAEALARINRTGKINHDGEKIVPILAGLLNDTNAVVRWNAIGALSTFDSHKEKVAPLLLRSLHDPDAIVRQVSSNCLRRIAPQALTTAQNVNRPSQ